MTVSTDVSAAATVRANVIHDIGGIGLNVGVNTKDDVFARNKVLGVAGFHCQDLSSGTGTGGSANVWVNNTGLYAAPDGICKPS